MSKMKAQITSQGAAKTGSCSTGLCPVSVFIAFLLPFCLALMLEQWLVQNSAFCQTCFASRLVLAVFSGIAGMQALAVLSKKVRSRWRGAWQ